MNYIESDREGEFFNPASETVQINPPESTSSDPVVKELSVTMMALLLLPLERALGMGFYLKAVNLHLL